MITLYGMTGPNVLKILLMLEEIEAEYQVRHVAVMRGEGLHPGFLAISPFGKVPVIVDSRRDGEQTLFESGAILMYLAETYAPSLLPQEGPDRWSTLTWLFGQVAFAGPMLGQLNHFHLLPSEAGTYAAGRYRDQAAKVYRDFDRRLAEAPWLGGGHYSIADIAMYPWSAYLSRHEFREEDFPHLTAWRARIDARPAWRRAQAAIARLAADDTAAQVHVTDEDFDRFFNRSHAGPPVDFEGYLARGSNIRNPV